MVSVSAQTPTSPLCRSPLSQSSFPRHMGVMPIPETSAKRDRQQQQRPDSSDDEADAADDYVLTSARRPSTTIALSPRRLSTSRSLAGSYTLSLLSSRMSTAHPTHHVPSAFTLKLSSVSPGKGVPSGLKCPQHVKIPFDARWYALDSSSPAAGVGSGAAWTPWVGNVDVEEHYARQYRNSHSSSHAHHHDHDLDDGRTRSDLQYAVGVAGRGKHPRPRPGYQVGICGKIQLFIMQTVIPSDDRSNGQSSSPTATGKTTPVKVFLVDYDLSSLQPGGRLLYKERAYQTLPNTENAALDNTGEGRGREVLKYAIELQFLCVAKRKTGGKYPTPPTAMTTEDSSIPTTDKKRKRLADAPHHSTSRSDSGNPHASASYYLGKQIRLVFPTNSSALHPTDGPLPISSPTSTTKANRRYSATNVPAAPSIRIERLIEVQNPPPPPPPLSPAQVVSQTSPLFLRASSATTRSQYIGSSHHPTADTAPQQHESARFSFSGSFTSESWEGLRQRWNMQAGRAAAVAAASTAKSLAGMEPEQSKMVDEARDNASGTGVLGFNGHHQSKTRMHDGTRPRSPNTATAILPPPAATSSGLVFTRSPTPVAGGLSLLKSPSLLTARLEEMSGSGSFASSPPPIAPPALAEEYSTDTHDTLRAVAGSGGKDSARASEAGRRRKASLWPALGGGEEDHERLLSESLKKLPISYHR